MALPTLVVVESPNKERTIAKLLGPGYIVRSTMGHIVDLARSKTDRFGVDIDAGFVPKYSVIPGKKDRVKSIVDAAKQSRQIYIAADPDREGEAIAWHVADQVRSANKPIKRVLFHEITKKSVEFGVSNPGELDKNLYDSQQARRVLDRLVGFMVSPYLWNAFGGQLSAGRVQSVCLRLIVDREEEIDSFIPEVYYNITAALAKPSKQKDGFVARYPNRITNEKKAIQIKKDLEESSFHITNIDAKEQKRNPPQPLTTSKLQQVASARFKFSTKKTMSAAQGLYEGGHVSYIRTDSVRSSPESIASAREWLTKEGYKVPSSPNIYKTNSAAQDAHEAIRPTNVAFTPDKFIGADDQKKLYKLIWEKFVASQMKPALYDTVAITIKASKGHELKANGRTLKYDGWLAVCADGESAKDKEENVKLPVLKVGEELILIPPKVKSEKKQTQPPPRYSEGSLVKELEKRGIGRPSTYAAIIGKISDRAYVVKASNVFTPTEVGRKVANDLKKHFKFMEYDYTKEMEDRLDQIEGGKLKYIDMLTSFFEPFKNELRSAQSSLDKDGGQDCDKCGKRMKLKHSKFGYFIGCSGYPACKTAINVTLDGEKIVLKPERKIADGVTCPKCGAGMYYRDGKFGPFYSCSKYPSCNGSAKIPFGKKCQKCNSDLFLTAFKGIPKLACMGYPNCKNIEEVPPGTKVNWIDPKEIQGKKKNRRVQKILAK